MGNLLKWYANASGRSYSAQEHGEWRIVVDLVYHSIASRHRSAENAMILSWQINEEVRLGLVEALGLHHTSSFVRERGAESPAGDLNRLINYVVFRASEEESRRRKRRQEIRDEPSFAVRVGMRVQNVFR